MNSEGNEKTPDRHPETGASSDAESARKIGEFGGFSSPGAPAGAGAGREPVAEVLIDAEDPEERGRGAPKKPARARKDALRAYAASLGAEPGELLIATIMEGLQEWLDAGNALGDWMEQRAIQLARKLPMQRADAFKLLNKMVIDAMPYVHQKLPLAIEVEDGAVMFAMIGSDGKVISNQAGGLDMRPANVRQPALINDKLEQKSDDESRTQSEDDQ